MRNQAGARVHYLGAVALLTVLGTFFLLWQVDLDNTVLSVLTAPGLIAIGALANGRQTHSPTDASSPSVVEDAA